MMERSAGRNKSGFRKLISSCQKASDNNMLIAVDEEGGTVVRASYYRKFRKSKFHSPRQVYKKGKYKAITGDTKAKDALRIMQEARGRHVFLRFRQAMICCASQEIIRAATRQY